MGISLLAPLFLAGLVALVIPVLIHLSQKTRKDAIPFPSLMFLSKVPYKEVRRQRIRNWLIFLLRSAVIVGLVGAFSRPLLRNSAAGPLSLADARELVIMLDRSFSMAYGDRWERSLGAARELISGLGPEDRATLIIFSDRATALRPPGRDPTSLGTLLSRVAPSHGATRFGAPIELAAQVLGESELLRREAVMISDLQRVGWDEEMDVKLPPGTRLRIVNTGASDLQNVAVADVTFDRNARGALERVTVSARIANVGPDPASDVPVALEIEGEPTATRRVTLSGHEATTVRFPEVVLPEREVRGVVRAGDDRLPVDNVFRFLLSPGQSIHVLVLQHPAARPDAGLYLERALSVGSSPPHRVVVKRVTEFVAADLVGQAVVILNDVPFPSGAGGRALQTFLESGGGILSTAGQRAGAELWGAGPGLVAAVTAGQLIDRLRDRGGTLSITDYDHPAFELFNSPRSGDFSRARFFSYRRIAQPDSATVIARFDDGGIALAEIAVGSGRLLVWTSDLTGSWNDFPLQPVFLPFVHRVVRYLADYVPERPSYTVGEVVDLAEYLGVPDPRQAGEPLAQDDQEIVVSTPSGTRSVETLAANQTLLRLEEQGFYEFRRLSGDRESLHSLAVNVDPVESDLTPLDAEEFASAVTALGDGSEASGLAAVLSPSERERRQGLWRYLLVLVLVALVTESVISNRVTRRQRIGERNG